MEIKIKQPTKKQADYIADNLAGASNGKVEKREFKFFIIFLFLGIVSLALTFIFFTGITQIIVFVVGGVCLGFAFEKFKSYRMLKDITQKMEKAVEKNEVSYFSVHPKAAAIIWYTNKEDAIFLFELEGGRLLSLAYRHAASLKNFPNTDFDFTWLGSKNYFLFADIETKGEYLAPAKEMSIVDIMKYVTVKQYNEIVPKGGAFFNISNGTIKDIIK